MRGSWAGCGMWAVRGNGEGVARLVLAAIVAGGGFVLGDAVRAADRPAEAWRGARIRTATGKTFDPGTLVVRGGKIVAVGDEKDVAIPEGAVVHDVRGKVLIPGLVDSHSHLGVYSRPSISANSDGNEMTGPVQTLVRALDALNPYDPGIRMATAGGVTTANVMPGSGNVIGGQTIYVKLRGHTPEQMWIEPQDVLGGLKMANGENPKRSYGGRGQAPGTRFKVAAMQRAEFLKAQAYRDRWDRHRQQSAAGKDGLVAPDVDLSLEPLVEVLARRRTVHFHSHRADDILTVLRLKQEFGFEVVLQHGTEAYKVLDEVARAGVPVSMTIVDSPGGKAEVVDFLEECGAELHRHGIPVVVNTDDPVTESRFMLRTAAVTVRGGLDPEIALQAVTATPARALHLDHRVGTLESGKDADFVLLSGEPFSVYSRVLETYIDGKRVFDLADARDRLYQTGGFAVAEGRGVPPAAPLVTAPVAAKDPQLPPKSATATAEHSEFVVVAGRVHPVSSPAIDDGVVHVRDGKIVHVGPRAGFKFPAKVPVLAAREVTPGLIDAYSIVPLSGQLNISADQDADEKSDPNQADVRVLDGFNPHEPLLRFLLEQGITVVHACPGRANVVAGTSGVFRTHGSNAESMAIKVPSALVINLGESPKETYKGQRPGTRMGTAALLRQAFGAAANAKRKAAGKTEPGTDRNLKTEALQAALDKKVRTVFTAQRADDLLTALRVADEFGLDAVLALAAEGYLVSDEVRKSGVPVIAHPTMQRIGEPETYHSSLANAAFLTEKGIRTAISSGFEGYVPKTRVVRHEAAIAAVHGLGPAGGLKAVTLEAAEILGIADRYGSLEPGKTADLVLYDGDPFEHATHVTRVIVGGRVVHDRTTRPRLPLAQRIPFSSAEPACCNAW